MEEQHVGIQPYISLCSGIGGLDLGLKLALPSARAVCYLEGREQLQGQEEGQKWPQLPTFPPVPSSTAWKEILEYWPELAPAKEEAQPSVRRVANGVTFRVERLRACGNSVVPIVAAKAFRTLAD